MLKSLSSFQFNPKYLAKLIAFAVLYIFAAHTGLLLATIHQKVSPVWPATGISFAILFLAGIEYWPAIVLGAFTANHFNAPGILPVLPALFITGGNTLQAVVGTKLLQYFSKNPNIAGSHTRTIGIVLASLIGACIASIIGTSTLSFFHQISWAQFTGVWFTWFTGDCLGGVTVLPLLLAFSKKYSTDYQRKNPHWYSILFLLAVGIFLSWLLFIRPEGSPFLFFIFPYLFWCASVGGERGASIATVLISIFGVCSVQFGFGVFNHGSLNNNLINLQLFLASVGVSSLMMTDLKRNTTLRHPAVVLLFSWLFAGLFFFGFYIRSLNESDKHFSEVVDAVEPLLQARISLYYSALQSGTGLFAASDNVKRSEWKEFLDHSKFEENLPGNIGLGVIFRVKKSDLSTFVKRVQKDDASDFTYHLLDNLTSAEIMKAQARKEAFLVTFIEPMIKNKRKIGLDLASEDKRRMAAELARDTGEPTITPTLNLIDDLSPNPAFLIYYPFYTKGSIPRTVQERRKRLIGWTYAPLYAKPFLDSIFSLQTFKGVSYSVSENDEQRSLISSSDDFLQLPDTHSQKKYLKLGNRSFQFYFKRSKDFYSNQDTFSSWAGAAASIISLLIGTFIVSLQTVKRNAQELAEKRTEALRASEELWKFALEGAGDSVWDWNIPNNDVKFTKKFEAMLGYDEHELKNDFHVWKAHIHPDDYQRVFNDLNYYLKTKNNFVSEHRLLCKNGHYKWVLSRGMVVKYDEQDRPVRMVGTISDITSWKEAEFEIDRQRAKFHAIFETSNDAIMLFSPENGFSDCNSQAVKLFGLKNKEEFISMQPDQISPSFQPDGMSSLEKSKMQIEKALKFGVNQFEWVHRRANGEDFPADVTLSAFTLNNERVIQACIRDLTEKKLVESALNSQREKLMAAAKMSSLGEMAGGIAHEINNPLAIIIGKTAQLKRKMRDEGDNLKNYDAEIGVIEATSKRISAIIKGLSAFSRNAENDQMQKILVPQLIQDTLELSKERFRFHSIDLKFNLESSDQTYVNGRASQLLQVLINLLNNAYDAVEHLPEKWVRIVVSTDNEKCIISVTDSGPGISPNILEKIMTPFFTTKDVGKGTGLGLSISKGIIEEHHGKLYYDTTSTHTRFIIELPIA